MRRHKKMIKKWLVCCLTVIICLSGVGCTDFVQTGGANPSGNNDGKGISDLEETLEVHFIDVGQGDATLIKEGEHALLIDAGENNQGSVVVDYLNSQNIKQLDYVIGTHPDSDHIGGLDVVIEEYTCEKVIMPDVDPDTRTYDDVVSALNDKNLSVTAPKVGDTYSLGDASFTIIAPVRDYGDDTNNWSVGIRLTFGEDHFLFTGDAEATAETDMIDSGIDLSADVYKAAHHGSKTGSSENFLDAVQPDYSVISCGEDNEYGHPSAQTLNEFRTRGIQVFRTDEQGTVVAVSDGSSITWNTSPDESWKSGEPKGSSGKNSTGIRYIINTNTKKFHRPECSHVDDIKNSNRKNTTETKSQLEKQGYVPCGTCNP